MKEASNKLVLECTDYFYVRGDADTPPNVYWGQHGVARSYLVFDALDTKFTPEQISKAKLYITVNQASAFTKPVSLGIYQILEAWDESLSWDSRPLSKGEPTATIDIFNDDSIYECDITAMVKSWATTKTTYGVLLALREVGSLMVAGMKSASKRHPRIEITIDEKAPVEKKDP